MTDSVMQVKEILDNGRDSMAVEIARQWDTWYRQMAVIRSQWSELSTYLFATDTTTTTNSKLPWKNKTTMPKLTQIRDNLHSNYMTSLFPNEDWLTWEAYTNDAADQRIANSMKYYMMDKLRQGHFRNTASKLVYDWIDTGNVFAMPRYESRKAVKFGEEVWDFNGPKLMRISPYDIAFDITASDFKYTPKIVRSLRKIGDLAKEMTLGAEYSFWEEFLEKRKILAQAGNGMKQEDWEKQKQFDVDGFGNLQEYFKSGFVEVLEFWGDWYDQSTGELHQNQLITVVDRSFIARKVDSPTYAGTTPIFHCAWRKRPDNLMGMGPLDNLIGMQYRLDHLENLKADAMDLIVWPPLKIVGSVDEFDWGPGTEIHVGEGGDVQEMTTNLTRFAATQQDMTMLEDRMELYAGAPREAMGMRTPGEKTAFEVDTLTTAAGSIRRSMANIFEEELLEPSLNAMLELAHANFNGVESVPYRDSELGITEFIEVNKNTFTSEGVLRPVGARHFAQQQADMQNLNMLFSGPIGQMVAPHTSGKELTRLIDNTLNLRGYKIFLPNVAVMEQQETQGMINAAQDSLNLADEMDPDSDIGRDELPMEEEEEVDEI